MRARESPPKPAPSPLREERFFGGLVLFVCPEFFLFFSFEGFKFFRKRWIAAFGGGATIEEAGKATAKALLCAAMLVSLIIWV